MGHETGGSTLPRWVWGLLALLALGVVVYVLRGVLTPIFIAFLIAYLLDPVVDRFEARRLPRALGIGVMLTLLLAGLALVVLLAVPWITRDVAVFVEELPELIARVYVQLDVFLRGWGIEMPRTWAEATQKLDLGADTLAGATSPAAAVVGWLLGGTVSLVGAFAGIVLVPVFAAYLLHDFDLITGGIRDLIPVQWRPNVVEVAREIDDVLGEFIRGQLIVMVLLAVMYSLAYALLGVRLAVLIGCIAGLLSFIPYVGGAIALGLAVLMCVFNWDGWGQLVGVVLAYGGIQGVEGFVITPRVVGEKVGLSAIWVLFALMVGGELFGFLGILLALPAAAVIKIFVMRGLRWYRSSTFFLAPPPPDGSSWLSGIFSIERVVERPGDFVDLPDLPDLPDPADEEVESARTAIRRIPEDPLESPRAPAVNPASSPGAAVVPPETPEEP